MTRILYGCGCAVLSYGFLVRFAVGGICVCCNSRFCIDLRAFIRVDRRIWDNGEVPSVWISTRSNPIRFGLPL